MCCQPRQKRACFRVLLGLFLHFFQIDGMEPRDSRSEFSALRRWGLVSFDKNQDFRSHRKNPLIWNLQGSSRSLISFCSKKSQNPTFWGFRVPRKGGTVEEQLRNCRCAQKCSRSEVFGSGCEYRTLVPLRLGRGVLPLGHFLKRFLESVGSVVKNVKHRVLVFWIDPAQKWGR